MLQRITQDRRVRTVGRYGLATFAPALVSAAHFVMQITMLRAFAPADFGLFAVLLALLQFGFGLSNALVVTPFTVCLNLSSFSPRQSRMFFQVNLLFALAWGAACAVLAVAFDAPGLALPFGIFAALSMIRWFGRAAHYAHHQPVRAAVSDLAYALVLLLALGIAWLADFTMESAVLGLIVASAAGIVTLGRDFFRQQFRQAWAGRLSAYGTVWRTQARWTLLGVTTTELTTNAHTYLVTFLAGPAAFAPIAAVSLFFKPVVLCATSLTQLERPAMTRAIAGQDVAGAVRVAGIFRLTLIAAWIVTMVGGTVLLAWYPALLLKGSYDLETILTTFALSSVTTLIWCIGTPVNVFLQAAGVFDTIAMASVFSSAVSLAAATLLLFLIDPIWSLAGILAGQIVMVIFLFRTVAGWSRRHV